MKPEVINIAEKQYSVVENHGNGKYFLVREWNWVGNTRNESVEKVEISETMACILVLKYDMDIRLSR